MKWIDKQTTGWTEADEWKVRWMHRYMDGRTGDRVAGWLTTQMEV